jgi:hypothetical protein
MRRPTDLAASRVLLVADRRDTVAPRDPDAAKIRRYRLARVQLNTRTPASRSARHAQLTRLYD